MLPAIITLLLVFLVVLGLGQLLTGRRRRLINRLERLKADTPEDAAQALRRPFSERIIFPLLENIGQQVARLTPKQMKGALDKRLVVAGPPLRTNPVRFLSLLGLLTVALPVLTAVVVWKSNLPFLRSVVAVVLAAASGAIFPLVYLDWRINQRQQAISRSLPSVLDLLVVSVEAGLGFDMALHRVTEQIRGPLADELGLTLNEIRLGRTRRAALRDLTARTEVSDLTTFISSIIQADQLGVSIGNVLRVQSDSLRVKQRQRFQEQAMKASIKMLFPTIFLILPALFIVILGPAFLSIMKVF
ncbi:MAG: type II secretion system F family protein [bacterium]